MEEVKAYQELEIVKVKVDFDKLDKWVKPGSDDLPVYSFLSLYEACGLEPYIKQYSETHNNAQIVAADNLLCNFYTLQHLKNNRVGFLKIFVVHQVIYIS